MNIRILVAPFLLSIGLLATGIVFTPNTAFGYCCGCGNCWMMYIYGTAYCYCGGDCPYCSTDDFDPAQRGAAINNHTLDKNFLPNSPSSSAQRLDVAEGVFNQMSGGSKCFRDKVALSLLGNARERFVPIPFNDKIQEQNLTF